MKRWTEDIGKLVLYKNNQLIALNKPAGMPVQADPSGDKALLDLAEIYAKHPLHLIHRIDRPASGLVLLAKNKRAMTALTQQFAHRKVGRSYLAVVSDKPDPPTAELSHYLLPSSRHRNRMRALDEPQEGAKESRLTYSWLASSEHYHLLRIDLHSGRHHQIRAQLAAVCLPIKGDTKYGFRRSNPDRSIHLHAWSLTFEHPVNKSRETLVAPPPEETLWQAFPIADLLP